MEAALWNDCVRALYDKETLREVLKALIATRYNIHSVNSLKQDLYTQEELDAAFQENTKAVFGETIANPALVVLDLEKFANAAHAHGVPFYCG